MIKSDAQLKRTEHQLHQLKGEVQELMKEYSGEELEFWAGGLMREVAKLQAEIDEYKELRHLPFEAALEGPLQRPFPIENISQLLSRIRVAAKLTQAEMADRLGWQQSNLSRFEHENYSSQSISKTADFAGAVGVRLYVTPFLSSDARRGTEVSTAREQDEQEPLSSVTMTYSSTQPPDEVKAQSTLMRDFLVGTGMAYSILPEQSRLTET